ncbi:MAG: B12-binding domain-containing radical SAM protein [Nanoarchaeota archaeon]|nr:B12-binding domain-containing radical SAM protein [Nanoarchaeota archaeon]
MRVLFVLPDFNYLDFISDYSGFNHIGLAYLSACLKQENHDTKLLHLTKELPADELISLIKEINPDLICYTAFSNQFHYIKKVAPLIKKELNILTVCGGIHATVHPEDTINIDGIDMVCIGEGEKAIVELANKLEKKRDISKIKSLWVKKNNKIIKNEVNNLNQDLDSLPSPDMDLFDFRNLSGTKLGKLNVIATRGCPYQCGYCANHQLQRIYKNKGKYVRFRSVDKVIHEIKDIKEKYPGMNHLEFLDDCFCLNKTWIKDFIQKYKKEKINLPMIVNTRVDLLDDELLKELKSAGMRELCLGVETGNEEIREKILNKHISNAQIIKTFKLCKKYGFENRCYVMVGIPFENMGNALETVKLCSKIQPTYLHVSIFQPYPNTALYDLCLKNGFINKDINFQTYFDGVTVLNQNSITKGETVFAFTYFRIFVRLYERFRNKQIRRLLDKIFLNKKLHKPLMKLYPLAYALVFPMQAPYRLILKTSPKTARFLKKRLIMPLRRLKG